MLRVLQSTAKQVTHVVIVQAIENMPTFLARTYQFHLSEMAQMVGYGRIANIDQIGQFADIHIICS